MISDRKKYKTFFFKYLQQKTRIIRLKSRGSVSQSDWLNIFKPQDSPGDSSNTKFFMKIDIHKYLQP